VLCCTPSMSCPRTARTQHAHAPFLLCLPSGTLRVLHRYGRPCRYECADPCWISQQHETQHPFPMQRRTKDIYGGGKPAKRKIGSAKLRAVCASYRSASYLLYVVKPYMERLDRKSERQLSLSPSPSCGYRKFILPSWCFCVLRRAHTHRYPDLYDM